MSRADEDSISSDSRHAQPGDENEYDMESEDEEISESKNPTQISSNYIVANVDGEGYITIAEEIIFIMNGEREIRKAGRPFIWKGIEWTTLVVGRQQDGIGMFLGYDDPSLLPSDFSVNLSFRYTLFPKNNKSIESVMIRQLYQAKHSKQRDDYGRFGMFPYHALDRIGHNQYRIKYELKIFENFTPKRVPPNYDSKRETGMVGLQNLGATCYLNSLLQMLFHLNSFRKAVYKIPHENEDYKTSTTLALQNVFHNLQSSSSEVTTKDLTTAFGWSSVEAFMQQDVQEMMRILIDKLEDKMKGTDVDGYAKELFCGRIKSFVRCIHVDFESAREEEFYDIQLDVKGCKTLYDSFNKYIATEVLDGDNQYDSGKYGKQDAKKGVIFTKFPPVLTVQLKRFDFDLQTLGFKKIHDHLKFPLRLELNKYIRPEVHSSDHAGSSENSENIQHQLSQLENNNYLLHSVLVHSGDVGGGHYYAFIRPSNTQNYQTVYSEERENTAIFKDENAEWFKFNDEIVLPVSKYEAVDYCFGRSKGQSKNEDFQSTDAMQHIMSSAYMLVYIRESDAPTIMKPLVEEDIPSSLIQRLQAENRLRKIEEIRSQRLKLFKNVAYVTEREIANFQNYTRFQGFIDESSMKKLKVMTESTLLGVLLDIARELDVLPTKIRLWEIDKVSKSLAISDHVAVEKLRTNTIKDHAQKYFIEVGNEEGGEEEITLERDFAELYEAEKVWLEKLKESLFIFNPDLSLFTDAQRSEQSTFDGKEKAGFAHYLLEDITYGCGIGKSNKPLFDLEKFDAETFEALSNEMKNLEARVFRIVEEFWENLGDDPALIFFKLYDPTDLISLPHYFKANSSSNTVNRLEIAKMDYLEELPFEDVTYYLRKKRPKYNPVKYIGLGKTNRTADRITVLIQLLKQRLQHLQRIAVMENQTINPMLLQSEYYSYYNMDSPGQMREIHFQNDQNISEYFYEGGGIAFVAFTDLVYSELNIPSDGVTRHPAQYFKSKFATKTFDIRPFEARDCKVLYYHAKWNNYLSHEHDTEQQVLGKKRQLDREGKRDNGSSFVEEQHTQPLDGGITGETTSTKEIRPSQTQLIADESEDDAASPVHRIEIVCGVELEFNLQTIKTSDFVRELAKELKVEYGHLLVYMDPNNDAAKPFSQMKPLTGAPSEETLLSYLQLEVDIATSPQQGNNNPRYSNQVINLTIERTNWLKFPRLTFFYRIIPFAFSLNGIYTKFEVIICDERLRYLRKLWILHSLQKKPNYTQIKDLLFDFESHPYNNPLHYEKNYHVNGQGQNSSKRLKTHSHDTDDSNHILPHSSMDVEDQLLPNNPPHAVPSVGSMTELASEAATTNHEWLNHWFSHTSAFKTFFQQQSESHHLDYLNEPRDEFSIQSFDFIEYHKLRVQFSKRGGMLALLDRFRNLYLGIPQNYEALSNQFHNYYRQQLAALPSTATGPVVAEGKNMYYDELDELKEFVYRYTRSMKEISNPAFDDDTLFKEFTAQGQNPCSDKIEFVSSEVEGSSEEVGLHDLPRIQPALPLLLGHVYDGRVMDIYSPHYHTELLKQSWFSGDTPLSETLYSLQSVTMEDLFWFKNQHSTLSSRMVSVFNFTLIGNTVQVCDCDMFSGPFITYLRQDDTYWTFLQRCAIITGERDLYINRIAIVEDNTPHFLTKPAIPSAASSSPTLEATTAKEDSDSTTGSPAKKAQQQQTKQESLWETAAKYYPTLSASYLEGASTPPSRSQLNKKKEPPSRFVFIGIQRSSAEVKALNTQTRHRGNFNQGIKIS